MTASAGAMRPDAYAAIGPVRARTRTARLSVGFILTRRFTLCAFANFVDVLRLAADEGDRSRPIMCQWSILSDTMDPITASCGVTVQPQERLGDPKKFDYIAVIGGLTDGIDDVSPAYKQYLHRASDAGVPLIGICTGAFVLHQAGLLNGYRCCVSWFHHADFLEQFDGLDPVSDQIFIVDRNRLTCSGGVSSAHLAAYLVEKHVGSTHANKSLHIMIIDGAQQADKPQPGIPMNLKTQDPIVKRALLIMQQHIDMPPPISEIASRLGSSKRQLERHFRAALDTSPQAAFLVIRLALARHLIETSDRSISTIAVECGFCDSSHMCRLFRRQFGTTPHEMRTRITKRAPDATGGHMPQIAAQQAGMDHHPAAATR